MGGAARLTGAASRLAIKIRHPITAVFFTRLDLDMTRSFHATDATLKAGYRLPYYYQNEIVASFEIV